MFLAPRDYAMALPFAGIHRQSVDDAVIAQLLHEATVLRDLELKGCDKPDLCGCLSADDHSHNLPEMIPASGAYEDYKRTSFV